MKRRILSCLAIVFLGCAAAGCIMPGEVKELLAASQAGDEAKVIATVERAVARSEEAIDLANDVKNGSMTTAEGGGWLAIGMTVAMAALNTYRNRTRQKELELQALKSAAAGANHPSA